MPNISPGLMFSFFAAIACTALAAQAEPAPENCTRLSVDTVRLACFDTIYPPTFTVSAPKPEPKPEAKPDQPVTPAPGFVGRWLVTTDVSSLTDQKNVYMQSASIEDIPSRFGGGGAPGSLLIRCKENTTAVLFGFNDRFMASIQGYGRIEYRLDDLPMARMNTNESTNNKVLGLWSGRKAIPFVKRLLGHKKLTLRATPFNDSPITLTYDLTGIDEAIPELRETCHW